MQWNGMECAAVVCPGHTPDKSRKDKMYYQIKETLTPCAMEDIIDRKPGDPPYVVITDPETWTRPMCWRRKRSSTLTP